ncbi:MAG: cadmium-translocating P-type ATPase [Proteobacteria bacterium]|nr:cadmium-translocating P-type ATPase [Pseudomonadota bacterium]
MFQATLSAPADPSVDDAPASAHTASALQAVLDDRAGWEAFSRPAPAQAAGACWESHVAIDGMHCATCSLTLEQALRSVPGVLEASVNGASQMARVVWAEGATRPSQWFGAVARAGYQALPATDLAQREVRARAQRTMLWRWLVAGFCMMQVMMYAFPAYVAEPGEMTADAAQLLRWASWVLTLPVMLFSCRPFFASAWRDLRQRTIGMDVPVALGILIAFGASTAATFDPTGPWGAEVWYDSLTMLVFFLLSGRMLEQRLRDRTAGSLDALSRRLPDSVERQRADGSYERVAVRRLAAGDVVRVMPGEAFPADGTVLSGATTVDEALLTGESQPVPRAAGAAVVAGSHNLSSVVEMKVERVGADTRYAGIVALMGQAAAGKPRLAQLADRMARPFLVGVLLATAASAVWWWRTDPAHAISVAIAVLIVTCPCALSLATPAATLAAAGALARRGVLVRRLQALETCTTIDTVVFDKTGTLTLDRMAVSAVHTREGADAAQALRLAAALARHSLHPASRAIVAHAGEAGTPAASGVEEIHGSGLRGQVAGHSLCLGSAALCGAPVQPRPDGVLQVHLADAQGWLATFDLDETIRPDAQDAMGALRAMGLRLQLLSGDRMRHVARLAWRVNINHAFGDRTPEGKLAHVRDLQARGHRVAMVGDGINDAPVLACADLAITLGQAAPITQSRADVVVPGGQLAAVAALVLHAQRTRVVVRQNLLWAAVYNAVCVPLAVLGLMPPWLAGLGMAASSLGVVLNSARLARAPRF